VKIELDQQQFNDLCEEVANIGEHRVRADYSGRGMYGKTCIGVECKYGSVDSGAVQFALAMILSGDPDRNDLSWYEVRDAMDEVPESRSDSMGLGQIVYFPGLTIEEGVEVLDNDF
jgi:hypothetical protein